MDHKAGNQLPHGWMMGFSTVQVENVFRIHVGKEIPHTVFLIWAQMLGWGHSCLEIFRQLGSRDGLAPEFLFNYLLKLCHNQRSFL